MWPELYVASRTCPCQVRASQLLPAGEACARSAISIMEIGNGAARHCGATCESRIAHWNTEHPIIVFALQSARKGIPGSGLAIGGFLDRDYVSQFDTLARHAVKNRVSEQLVRYKLQNFHAHYPWSRFDEIPVPKLLTFRRIHNRSSDFPINDLHKVLAKPELSDTACPKDMQPLGDPRRHHTCLSLPRLNSFARLAIAFACASTRHSLWQQPGKGGWATRGRPRSQ